MTILRSRYECVHENNTFMILIFEAKDLKRWSNLYVMIRARIIKPLFKVIFLLEIQFREKTLLCFLDQKLFCSLNLTQEKVYKKIKWKKGKNEQFQIW